MNMYDVRSHVKQNATPVKRSCDALQPTAVPYTFQRSCMQTFL
jgi:hypothetical protein